MEKVKTKNQHTELVWATTRALEELKLQTVWFEYKVNAGDFIKEHRVDIVAKTPYGYVAIEVGSCPLSRIVDLRKRFTSVVHIPYCNTLTKEETILFAKNLIVQQMRE